MGGADVPATPDGVVIVTFATVTEEPLIARSPYTLEPEARGTVGASVTWSRVTPVSPSASNWPRPTIVVAVPVRVQSAAGSRR